MTPERPHIGEREHIRIDEDHSLYGARQHVSKQERRSGLRGKSAVARQAGQHLRRERHRAEVDNRREGRKALLAEILVQQVDGETARRVKPPSERRHHYGQREHVALVDAAGDPDGRCGHGSGFSAVLSCDARHSAPARRAFGAARSQPARA